MNKNVFEGLRFKVFQSGNPMYLYIGINVVLFLVVALLKIPFFLSGNGVLNLSAYINEYAGFPAAIDKLPFRFYTIITYQFFHADFLHLVFNMIWLYWLGKIFLDFLKPRQFHFVYLAGGIAGALMYLLAYNIFPVFASGVPEAVVIGSSAAVTAIIIATATLVPDYGLSMLLIGEVKLKYLAAAYIALDLIGIVSTNAGGSFTHLGGALLGFAYIKLLQSGKDWSNLFKRKPKLRVVRNETTARPASGNKGNSVNQHEIDAILDKISKSGYEQLSREEKETLFKASKH